MPLELFGVSMRGFKKTAALLLSTTSLLAIVGAGDALAQQQVAQVPVEEVLITGSLIRGASAVGVAVTTLTVEDFGRTSAATISELLKYVPAVHVDESITAAAHGKYSQRGTYINLHLMRPTRSLLLVNGMRYPRQSDGGNQMDPGIIPPIAVDRIEILTSGTSAVYGSDAVSGVINIITKRRFDGALTQLQVGTSISKYGGGMWRYKAAQLYGVTWDSGDLTVSYAFSHDRPLDTTADRLRLQFTYDYSTWGLDNRTPVDSTLRGIVSFPKGPDEDIGTNCTNCFSIPQGIGWNFGDQAPGPTQTWESILTTPGVANQVNPFRLTSLTTPQERNSFTLAFDQDIASDVFGFMDVELFVDAFYQNRVARYFDDRIAGRDWKVPESNPYYPTGAPSKIRVTYNFDQSGEIAQTVTTGELGRRLAGGFNLEFPSFDWNGRIAYHITKNKGWFFQPGRINRNNVQAALGDTIDALPPSGLSPGAAAYTKPANVPFLNLFCDATTFQCNSPVTLDYIRGIRDVVGLSSINQLTANFNGPVFSLPAGDVRAAVGFDLVNTNYDFTSRRDNSHNAQIVDLEFDSYGTEVPATYVQVLVPVFGSNNAIPLFQVLDIEGSLRADRYYDIGTVTSPKISVDWVPIEGLLLRGSYGKSFLAAQAGQVTLANARFLLFNDAVGAADGDTLRACPVGAAGPVPGSAGEKLVNLGLAVCDPTDAGPDILRFPGGILPAGATNGSAPLRPANGIPAALQPEIAWGTNLGFDYSPTFVPGLTVGMTYWNVDISDFQFSPGSTFAADLQRSDNEHLFIYPDNPLFAQAVADLIILHRSDLSAAEIANIKWIADAGDQNIGSFLVRGIDFTGNYNEDFGNWGFWSAGISGTYYLEHVENTGEEPSSLFDDDGVPRSPRLNWQANLGWTDGTFSVTGSLRYSAHYFHRNVSPPAAILEACCPDYNNYAPNYITGDLSFGYETGTAPMNDYLRNINFRLVVNNVLDNHAPFQYNIRRRGAFEWGQNIDPIGRRVSLSVTKAW